MRWPVIFKLSVGCKLLDFYDILLNLITKAARVLRKYKYTLRYWIPASILIDFIVSKTHESSVRSTAPFFHSLELLPLDHTYPMILVDSQDSDCLDKPIPDPR